jgi:hypothetical protein
MPSPVQGSAGRMEGGYPVCYRPAGAINIS